MCSDISGITLESIIERLLKNPQICENYEPHFWINPWVKEKMKRKIKKYFEWNEHETTILYIKICMIFLKQCSRKNFYSIKHIYKKKAKGLKSITSASI